MDNEDIDIEIQPAVGQRWIDRGSESCPGKALTIAEGPKYDHTVPPGVDGEWWWCSNGLGIYTEDMRKGFYVRLEPLSLCGKASCKQCEDGYVSHWAIPVVG